MNTSTCFIKLLTAALLLSHVSTAQNIGIGTTSPAMKLHVRSTADTALLIDNTTPLALNTNTGFYFKNGQYYTGAIKTTGTATAFSRLGFFTFATENRNDLVERLTIADNGNVGIGVTDPSATLDINGGIKISGGSPGQGKVLMSDANGNGSWQNQPFQFSGFKTGIEPAGASISSGLTTILTFSAEEYDDPAAFFSNVFIVPATGLYHFEALLTWNITAVLFSSKYTMSVLVNGTENHRSVMNVTAGTGFQHTQQISFDQKLTTGQAVTVWVTQDSGIPQTVMGNAGDVRYSFFSGRRVY